jgi:hypothetical protein
MGTDTNVISHIFVFTIIVNVYARADSDLLLFSAAMVTYVNMDR